MIMLISTVSVLLTTITISVIGVYYMKNSILEELVNSAKIVGDRNAAYLLFADSEKAEENLGVLEGNQSIIRACMYNDLGQVFARYPNKGDTIVTCPTNTRERSLIGENHIEVMADVQKGEDRIGAMYIESNMNEVDRYIKKQTMIAFAVTFGVVIISFVMAISIQHTISSPILSLAATAREVSQNKDYNIRAHPFGNRQMGSGNEIAALTNAFNSMLQEIGERDKQLNQQNIALEKAKNVAESANRAKSQFLANISHELRTPLNAIIGFSSILINQLFGSLGDSKYIDYARDINESGSHLLDIINDILDLSKAEAGKLDLNFEEINVPKAIKKCVTIIADRAEKGQVTINIDIPKTLPTLIADRLRFIQIMLNLLSNAVKFTEPGGQVDIIVRPIETSDVLTHFDVTVRDTGIGMSPEDIVKAFQSFGQVDSGLDRKYEGTGLGLPLTKKLIELHHGDIKIESKLGIGTAVTVTLPAIPPVEAFTQDEESAHL
jgi:signal transduction histidine kinase